MDPAREDYIVLAASIEKLADAINRYCDQQEPQPPREAKPPVFSTATYDRKQSQAEREMHERFSSQQKPEAVPQRQE